MKQNPYRSIIAKTGEPVDDRYRLPGQQYPMMSREHELNASSNKDLLHQIDALIKAHANNEIERKPVIDQAVMQERRQALIQAFASKNDDEIAVIGQAMAAEIVDTATREGFTRRYLQYSEPGQGELNQVRLRHRDVIAWVASSVNEVTPTLVRDRKIIPPEFLIQAFILIDQTEINTSPGDLLGEKYEEGLEQIMVVEDRTWKKLADNAAVTANTLQYFTTLTPQIFSRIRSQVSRWGIPVASALISYDIWDDIIGNSEFSAALSPVSKYELIQEGTLGTLFGVNISTDAFRQTNLRVVGTGEIYIVGAPINHGTMSVRNGLLSEPINKYNDGKAQRGWFMHQQTSLFIGNSASVSKGQRI